MSEVNVVEESLPAVRNPVWSLHGTIDCELEHPQLGFIPFSASPEDCEPLGRRVFEAVTAGLYGAIGPCAPAPFKLSSVEVGGVLLGAGEVSQNRMLRAIHYLNNKPSGATVAWQTENGTRVDLTLEQLSHALEQAFELQQTLLFAGA